MIIEITPEEVKQRIAKGETPYMIDVREPDEYQAKNNNAQLIPLGKIQAYDFDDIKVGKDEEIIILCRSGRRSMLACMILEQMGFTDLKNLKGGIEVW